MNALLGRVLSALTVKPASFRALLQSEPAETEAIARELGLSAAALASVDDAGEAAMRLQERMLEAFGVKRGDVPAGELAQLRDVGVTCSMCEARRRCGH